MIRCSEDTLIEMDTSKKLCKAFWKDHGGFTYVCECLYIHRAEERGRNRGVVTVFKLYNWE